MVTRQVTRSCSLSGHSTVGDLTAGEAGSWTGTVLASAEGKPIQGTGATGNRIPALQAAATEGHPYTAAKAPAYPARSILRRDVS